MLRAAQPEQALSVRMPDRCGGSCGEFDPVDGRDSVGDAPVGLVAAEQHPLRPENLEREPERRRPRTDAVDVEPPQVLAGWLVEGAGAAG